MLLINFFLMKQNAPSPNKLDALYPLKKEGGIYIKKLPLLLNGK